MIYTYKYLEHNIENFHKKISHVFEEIFSYDLEGYDEDRMCELDFKECVNASPKLIKSEFEKIAKMYHALTPQQKTRLREAYTINSDIESACRDLNIKPIRFDQLGITIDKLNIIKKFQISLWENYPLNEKIKTKFNVVQDHFNKFIQLEGNKGKVCPFCGLYPISPPTDNPNEKNRDAYDHIAAESLYPFVSINFKNLVPACTKCNSNEKKTTDVFYKSEIRREVLYPYDATYDGDNLSVTIQPNERYNANNYSTLLSAINWDIMIQYAGTSAGFLNTWDEVYHIKDRYKRNLKIYEKQWYDELVNNYKEEKADGLSFDRYKEKVLKRSENQIQKLPLGILRYVYFNYFLSLDKFREYLETTIV